MTRFIETRHGQLIPVDKIESISFDSRTKSTVIEVGGKDYATDLSLHQIRHITSQPVAAQPGWFVLEHVPASDGDTALALKHEIVAWLIASDGPIPVDVEEGPRCKGGFWVLSPSGTVRQWETGEVDTYEEWLEARAVKKAIAER